MAEAVCGLPAGLSGMRFAQVMPSSSQELLIVTGGHVPADAARVPELGLCRRGWVPAATRLEVRQVVTGRRPGRCRTARHRQGRSPIQGITVKEDDTVSAQAIA